MVCKIGETVFTTNGHMGKVIKRYKPTASEITIQIQEKDGRIYYCPETMVVKKI